MPQNAPHVRGSPNVMQRFVPDICDTPRRWVHMAQSSSSTTTVELSYDKMKTFFCSTYYTYEKNDSQIPVIDLPHVYIETQSIFYTALHGPSRSLVRPLAHPTISAYSIHIVRNLNIQRALTRTELLQYKLP